MKSKIASMSAQMIVGLVILVGGFLILMWVFYGFGFKGNTDREVCHASVIARAITPSTLGAKNMVPLNCKTRKICATESKFFGSGDCKEYYGDIKNIKKVKVKDTKQIAKLIADELVDCWSMMGEGKVSIFSQYFAQTYGFGEVYPSCVICSRIAFDKKLKDAGITNQDLEKVDVLDYMKKYKIPGKDITYYQYLINNKGKFSMQEVHSINEDDLQKSIAGLKKEIKESNSNYGLSDEEVNKLFKKGDGRSADTDSSLKSNGKEEIAILFMQVSSPKHLDSLKNLIEASIGIGVGGHFITKGVSTKVFRLAPWWVYAIVGGATIIGQQANVYYNREITAGYCGDLSQGKTSRDGCSVVRVVNYNKEDIHKYCSVIESID